MVFFTFLVEEAVKTKLAMSVWLVALDVFFDISFIYNGLYDFVCGIAILYFPEHGLAQLHSKVFTNTRLDPFVKRILAYWILTYGFPRLVAGFYRNALIDASCAVTYFVEGASYHVEQKYFKSANEKATFVAYASYVLGVVALVRACHQWAPVKGFTLTNDRMGQWQSIIAAIVSGIAWSYGVYDAMRQNQHASSPVQKAITAVGDMKIQHDESGASLSRYTKPILPKEMQNHGE